MKRSSLLPIACMALLAPLPALAHPGHESFSFMSGLAHPVNGVDHLLAMFAVGLLASMKGGRALWLWPLSFVGVMIAGAALGMNGLVLPFLEPVIILSVLILGLALALRAEVGVAAGAAMIAVFALFHGNAHGAEAPAGAALTYIAGFSVATALLHLLGLGLGVVFNTPRLQPVLRVSGAAMACAGALLFFV